jgi:hypothetical protein
MPSQRVVKFSTLQPLGEKEGNPKSVLFPEEPKTEESLKPVLIEIPVGKESNKETSTTSVRPEKHSQLVPLNDVKKSNSTDKNVSPPFHRHTVKPVGRIHSLSPIPVSVDVSPAVPHYSVKQSLLPLNSHSSPVSHSPTSQVK